MTQHGQLQKALQNVERFVDDVSKEVKAMQLPGHDKGCGEMLKTTDAINSQDSGIPQAESNFSIKALTRTIFKRLVISQQHGTTRKQQLWQTREQAA